MAVRAAALAAMLLASGAAALAYQVVWQRLLATALGVTIYATSVVLAGFMAGLALGSFVGGGFTARTRRPLRIFAAAELGVAALAPFGPAASLWAQEVAAGAAEPSMALRVALSFGLLLLPTFLMGTTLPAATAAFVRADASRDIAWLYGWNTLGASVGAIATGYWLIGRWGLAASLLCAAVLNLLAAVVALSLDRRFGASAISMGADPVTAESDASGPPTAKTAATATPERAFVAAAALSGFAALGLEVVWFRMLLAYLPTTTYAFTTMLATVLAGIGIGGVVAARAAARTPTRRSIGATLAAIGALSVAASTALAWTYGAGWRTSGLVQACALALLPPSIAMGLAFPRILGAATGGRPDRSRVVGRLGAANLAGALGGALVAGFGLVPALGTRTSLLALAALVGIAGLVLSLESGRPGRAAFAWALAGLAAAPLLLDPWEAARARRHPGETALWSEEGAQAAVAVHERADGTRVLYIDGAHQADDRAEMRILHERIGLAPLLLHPSPRRALVIGLAGGATPGALALDSRIAVDVVELAPAVARAAAHFARVNRGVLDRPNVRLAFDDGRNYLLRSRAKYDIVTADLVQPFHAGAGFLYSIEYFRLCAAALSDRGLMVQWIGHPPEEQYKLILRTFLDAFPHVTLFGEAFLVGSRAPVDVARDRFAEARLEGDLWSALEAAGLSTPEALAGFRTADEVALRRFAGPGPVLTDDHPRVEYFRSLGTGRPLDLEPLRSKQTR